MYEGVALSINSYLLLLYFVFWLLLNNTFQKYYILVCFVFLNGNRLNEVLWLPWHWTHESFTQLSAIFRIQLYNYKRVQKQKNKMMKLIKEIQSSNEKVLGFSIHFLLTSSSSCQQLYSIYGYCRFYFFPSRVLFFYDCRYCIYLD